MHNFVHFLYCRSENLDKWMKIVLDFIIYTKTPPLFLQKYDILVSLKAVRKKIGQLKLLPLMAKSSDFVHIVHTLNVLPLVPKEDVVSTYVV